VRARSGTPSSRPSAAVAYVSAPGIGASYGRAAISASMASIAALKPSPKARRRTCCTSGSRAESDSRWRQSPMALLSEAKGGGRLRGLEVQPVENDERLLEGASGVTVPSLPMSTRPATPFDSVSRT
jgi:hypothetical protein